MSVDTGVAVGGTGIGVGGTGVEVGGIRVSVGTGVSVGGKGVAVRGNGVGVGGTGVGSHPFSMPSNIISSAASTEMPHRSATVARASSFPEMPPWASTSSSKICFLMGSMKTIFPSGVGVGAAVGVAKGFGALGGTGVDVGAGVGVELQATNTNPKSNKTNLFTVFFLRSSKGQSSKTATPALRRPVLPLLPITSAARWFAAHRYVLGGMSMSAIIIRQKSEERKCKALDFGGGQLRWDG